MRIPLLPNETEEDYVELYQQMEKEDGRWPAGELLRQRVPTVEDTVKAFETIYSD